MHLIFFALFVQKNVMDEKKSREMEESGIEKIAN